MSDTSPYNAHFFFYGYRRPWRMLKGHEAPSESVTVLRSIPGNLVASGRDEHEATEKLELALDREIERAGGIERWYPRQLREMDEEEAAAFNKMIRRAWAKGVGFTKSDRNGRSYNVATLSDNDQPMAMGS